MLMNTCSIAVFCDYNANGRKNKVFDLPQLVIVQYCVILIEETSVLAAPLL